jgi:hypothetical protein
VATDVLGGSHALQETRAANPSLSVVPPPTTGGSVRRDDLFNTTMGGGVPYHCTLGAINLGRCSTVALPCHVFHMYYCCIRWYMEGLM